MSELIPLFSTPLYCSIIIDLDYNEINIYLKNNNFVHSFHQNKINLSTEEYIIDRLPKLKQNIITHLNIYLFEKLSFEPFEYYFSDSWFVKVSPGGNSVKHAHGNSLYSGVVYFDEIKEGGLIDFSSLGGISFMNSVKYILPTKVDTIFNSSTWSIKPLKGDILIFPSYINHEITRNESENDRYSFAFNIFPVNFKYHKVGARITQR